MHLLPIICDVLRIDTEEDQSDVISKLTSRLNLAPPSETDLFVSAKLSDKTTRYMIMINMLNLHRFCACEIEVAS